MPYTDSITSLANATCTRIRRVEQPRVDGQDVASIDTTVSFVASVQPSTGKDLQRLPEGRDATDLITIYTKTEIKIGEPGSGLLADLVVYKGTTYEVQHVDYWDALGSQYWKAVALAVI